VEQVRPEKDTPTEAHEITDDALAPLALARDVGMNGTRKHCEEEWQNKRYNNRDHFSHPSLHCPALTTF